MKMEFLAEGSQDCPLIRLYSFDVIEARRLREAFRSLWTATLPRLPLHEEWWMEPVDHCTLELRTGARDLGVVRRGPTIFECVLTVEGWAEITEKTDPFCTSEAMNGYQWLNWDGEIALLLSPNGQW
jgi:hypothetical protein